MVAALAALKTSDFPDLGAFRRRYPLTVANLGGLANREAWLRRVWELDERWRRAQESQTPVTEAITRGAPPASLTVEAEFDIIYGGGVLGLLHAATLAHRYGRSVMVFDAHAVGKTHRDWNISDAELRQFEAAGLFTPDELEAAIVNRYRAGFVKFHDAKCAVKAPPLWMDNVLDVAVEADSLLGLAARKIQRSGTKNLLCDGLRFVRASAQPGRPRLPPTCTARRNEGGGSRLRAERP